MFQSARQIWVWLNAAGSETVQSITPGFQSARQIWVWLNLAGRRDRVCLRLVSICQADLGLAELTDVWDFETVQGVSICQADLGLAEREREDDQGVRRVCFNLPGRFGFG